MRDFPSELTRRLVVQRLDALFSELDIRESPEEAEEECLRLAQKSAERALKKDSLLLYERYMYYYSKICANLSRNKNKEYLLKKVLDGGIKARDIPGAYYKVLTDEVFVESYRLKAIQNHGGTNKCRYCKKNAAGYVLLQTRSADEGISSMFHCRECGKSWKENN